MPHCLGAVDGRHIRIRKPPKSGSRFFNYKKFFSIVLQAVVDVNYRFMFIDVGSAGGQSDGGIFTVSEFFQAVDEGHLKLPKSQELPISKIVSPFYFVETERTR